GRQQLRQLLETRVGGDRWSAVDHDYQRILASPHITDRVDQYAILAKTIRAIPLDGFRATQVETVREGVHAGEPTRPGVDGIQHVQLAGMIGGGADEGNGAGS